MPTRCASCASASSHPELALGPGARAAIRQAGGFAGNYQPGLGTRGTRRQLLAQPLDAASNARFEASVPASLSQLERVRGRRRRGRF